MAYPDAQVYLLDAAGLREVAYTDTDHYLVTRGFLANPQRTLTALFDETSADADP
jgi:predicted ATPase